MAADTVEIRAPPKKGSMEKSGSMVEPCVSQGQKKLEEEDEYQETCLSGNLPRAGKDILAVSRPLLLIYLHNQAQSACTP